MGSDLPFTQVRVKPGRKSWALECEVSRRPASWSRALEARKDVVVPARRRGMVLA